MMTFNIKKDKNTKVMSLIIVKCLVKKICNHVMATTLIYEICAD